MCTFVTIKNVQIEEGGDFMNKAPVAPATPKLTKTTVEKNTVVQNIRLEGLKYLRMERVTTTFKVTRELNPKTKNPIKILAKDEVTREVKKLSFELKKVSKEELASYRVEGVSSFVVKVDEEFYHTAIPKTISFMSAKIMGTHQCGFCNRLSAASDKDGGCAKVRNRSKCIERYPWIKKGYETFNTRQDSFVVVECQRYQAFPPKKKIEVKQLNNLKIGLAQFIYPDAETMADVRMKMGQTRRD